jgi:integrase
MHCVLRAREWLDKKAMSFHDGMNYRSRGVARRDGAILLLTFASGWRRAEIAALNVEDLDFSRPGFLIITIRKSKTAQGCASRCRDSSTGRAPWRRSTPWLAILEQKKGPLFANAGSASCLSTSVTRPTSLTGSG